METCYLRLLSPACGHQSALQRRWINKKRETRLQSESNPHVNHLSHVRHEPDIFWSSSEFPLSWHGKRKRLLINSWNGAELPISLLHRLPPHPSYLSSILSGHRSFPRGSSFCWFITVRVGGNQEAIMAQRASDWRRGDWSLTQRIFWGWACYSREICEGSWWIVAGSGFWQLLAVCVNTHWLKNTMQMWHQCCLLCVSSCTYHRRRLAYETKCMFLPSVCRCCMRLAEPSQSRAG